MSTDLIHHRSHLYQCVRAGSFRSDPSAWFSRFCGFTNAQLIESGARIRLTWFGAVAGMPGPVMGVGDN